MSEAMTTRQSGRSQRSWTRMTAAACIVVVPTVLAARYMGIGINAQINTGIETGDLIAGLLGFGLSMVGGMVAQRFSFVGMTLLLHAAAWCSAIGFLLSRTAAPWPEVLQWNALAIVYSLFAAMIGAFLGVLYGRRVLGH